MSTKYPCQCCKSPCADGIIRRMPGAVRLGRSLMEQLVCANCQEGCCQTLNNEIWLNSPQLHTTKCNMCGEGFGATGPYYAHRRPLNTGEWVLAPVCFGCFDRYHECCTKLMTHGGH